MGRLRSNLALAVLCLVLGGYAIVITGCVVGTTIWLASQVATAALP
jgi:hypothetical protein